MASGCDQSVCNQGPRTERVTVNIRENKQRPGLGRESERWPEVEALHSQWRYAEHQDLRI